MPEQKFVIDGQEIVVDPTTLSPKAKENLLNAVKKTHEYAVETRPGMPEVKVPGLNSPGGNSIMDMMMSQEGPGMNARKLEELKPRLIGGALGALAGPVGSAMGMASPPKTMGEGLGILAGGTAGRVLGPMMAQGKGLLGMLGAAGAGIGENVAQQGGEAAGRLVTGDPSQGNPQMGWNTAASALLPALVKGGLQIPAAAAKKMSQTPDAMGDNAKDVLSKIMGKNVANPVDLRTATDAVTPPSNAKGMNLLSPFGRAYGKVVNQQAQALDNQRRVVDESKTFYDKLVQTAMEGKKTMMGLQNQLAQGKRATKSAIGAATTQLDDMEREAQEPFIRRAAEALYKDDKEMRAGMADYVDQTTSDVADLVEKRASIFAGRRQASNLKKGLPMGEGPVAVSAPDPYSQENLQRQIEDAKVKVYQDFAAAKQYKEMTLKPLEKAMGKAPEIDPNLKHFVGKDVKNVDDFQKKLVEATPMNIIVLRKALGTEDPAKMTPAIKSFEEGFTRHFAKLATGPDGTLSNVAGANKAYDFNKVKAIYGGGQRGEQKAVAFQKMVDSTLNLISDQKATSGAKVMEMTNIGSIPYVVVRGMMGNATNPLKSIARGLAGNAVTAMVVNWPKLVDYAVNNPKFGAQVEDWIATKSVDKTLTHFPLVEKYLKANNENKPK